MFNYLILFKKYLIYKHILIHPILATECDMNTVLVWYYNRINHPSKLAY